MTWKIIEIGLEKFGILAQPHTTLRPCRARNRNVDAAAEMYRTTLAWRSEPFDQASIGDLMDAFGTPGQYHEDGSRSTSDWTWSPHPNTLEAELAYRHAFFTRLPNQHVPEPILVWRAGHADYQGIVREDLVEIMIKAFVVHLEASRPHSISNIHIMIHHVNLLNIYCIILVLIRSMNLNAHVRIVLNWFPAVIRFIS